MPTFGRKVIYSDAEAVTPANVVDVFSGSLSTYNANAAEIRHLRNVYRGKTEILEREKTVRPEINNKIVVNHANEIVSFKVSYLLSEPITYVSRKGESADEINTLNEYMFLASKSAQDKQIADDFNICGVAYRHFNANPVYRADNDEAPFCLYTIRPENVMYVRTRKLGNKPIMAAIRMVQTDNPANSMNDEWDVWTETHLFHISGSEITRQAEHGLGCVPVFEYINNNERLGSFEIVETLLNAIDKLQSDRLNAVEQIVQAFMVFLNCELPDDGIEALRESGAIGIPSINSQAPADVKLITADMKQSDNQVLMDSLYKTILAITGMPAQSSEQKSDSSNNGAVFMRSGWYNADARAKDSELLWRQSETQFLRYLLRFIAYATGTKLKLSDIELKFTRRNYEDIYSKAQSLRMLLESGIHPLHAIAQVGMFPDPNEVYEQSKDFLEKWAVDPNEGADDETDVKRDAESMV